MTGPVRVVRWSNSNRDEFFRLHCDGKDAGWCQCVAWWVPTWDGWGERTAEQNRELRERLCDAGEYDGLLAYADGRDAPVGWCQVGPRDRLEKLVQQYRLEAAPRAWAVTCFQVHPEFRRQGVAATLLDHALVEAVVGNAACVEAFPKSGAALGEGELWSGPESLFRSRGFSVVTSYERGPVMRWTPSGR